MIISKFFEQCERKFNEYWVKICLVPLVPTLLRGNVYGCLGSGMNSNTQVWKPGNSSIAQQLVAQLILLVSMLRRGNVYGCLYAGMDSHAGAWEPGKGSRGML